MAYDFLGVMHRRQWEAFKAFTASSLSDLDPSDDKFSRQKALKRKIVGLQKMVDALISIARLHSGTQLPYYDRNTGNFKADNYGADYPMVVTEDAPLVPAPIARYYGESGQGTVVPSDFESSRRMSVLKSWQIGPIKHKKEHLEYRIKRCYDQIDQLLKELAYLDLLWPTGSDAPYWPLEVDEIENLFSVPAEARTSLFSGDFYPYTNRGIMVAPPKVQNIGTAPSATSLPKE